jgi:hypothetical protein
MNEAFDLDMESVLGRAGAAAEPAEVRLDQVFERVQLELEGLGSPRPAPARKSFPGAHASRLAARVRFLGWGALTASVGFWFGTQYARPVLEPSAVPQTDALVVSTPNQQQLPLGASPPTALLDDAPSGHDARATDRVAPEPASELPRAASARLASPRLRHRAQQAEPRLDFRAVLDHLRRAERAERGGMPELALSLLDDIDRGATPSILREERLLTRVLALCDQGDTLHARLRARELGHTTDDSIYASRLRASCINAKEEP